MGNPVYKFVFFCLYLLLGFIFGIYCKEINFFHFLSLYNENFDPDRKYRQKRNNKLFKNDPKRSKKRKCYNDRIWIVFPIFFRIKILNRLIKANLNLFQFEILKVFVKVFKKTTQMIKNTLDFRNKNNCSAQSSTKSHSV